MSMKKPLRVARSLTCLQVLREFSDSLHEHLLKVSSAWSDFLGPRLTRFILPTLFALFLSNWKLRTPCPDEAPFSCPQRLLWGMPGRFSVCAGWGANAALRQCLTNPTLQWMDEILHHLRPGMTHFNNGFMSWEPASQPSTGNPRPQNPEPTLYQPYTL